MMTQCKMKCFAALLWFVFFCTALQAGNRSIPLQLGMDKSAEQLIDLAYSALFEKNRPDSALIYSLLLATKFQHKKELTPEERHYTAMAYNRCGYIYMFFLFNYIDAMECLIKANKYCDDPRLQISISQNMGHLYSLYAIYMPSSNNVDAARHYYKEAFDNALEIRDWQNTISSFLNFWNFGVEEENIKAFKKHTELFRKTKIPINTSFYSYAKVILKAVTHLQRKQYDEAVSTLKKQIKRSASDGENRLHCVLYWHLASIYKIAEQSDSALHYALILEQMGKEFKMKDVETDANKLLYEIALQQNNKGLADHWQLTYFKNRDSLLTNNNLNNIKNYYLLHNVNDLTEEISNLKETRRLQNFLLISILGGISITILFLFILYRKNKFLKKQNLTLYQKIQFQIADNTKLKYSKSNLDEATKSEIKTKIEEAMRNTAEICKEDFSIERLSQLCQVNKKDISQVINEKFGQSFILLLSEYRIHEACRRINDISNSKLLTLEAIGASVGFKARESFSRAFKRVTGLSPSDYQKIAKERYKA